jgi:hypothetical protein
MTTTTRICTRCLEQKAITEFNFKDKRLGRRMIYCRICTREQVRRHYEANHDYYIRKNRKRRKRLKQELRACLLNYFKSHPCIDCEEADPVCLEFDHVRGKKEAEVSRMLCDCYSWDAIEAEINKCEVRCANCHRKRHAKRRLLAVFTPL